MRKRFPRSLPILFLAATLSSTGQAVRAPSASSDDQTHVALLPYTAHFKSTLVRPLADGTSVTTESTSVEAQDSHGRHLVTYTDTSAPGGGIPRTDFQVRDPVTLTMSYWSVPGTTAAVVHMPDLGGPETECAKKMKAINPLHPVSAETAPGETLPIEDLGTKAFLGVTAKGGRVSFTPSISRVGGQPPARRTNEVWTAIDAGLGGLIVRVVTSTAQGGTLTRELIEFTQSPPDPNLFEIPPDRQVRKREGQAYVCGISPAAKTTR